MMSKCKNRTTDHGQKFWDHVESIAKQVEEGRSTVTQPNEVLLTKDNLSYIKDCMDKGYCGKATHDLYHAYIALERERDAALLRCQELEQALRKYGRHKPSCGMWVGTVAEQNVRFDVSRECTCGLWDVRAPKGAKNGK
jgi:hypothetical protein